jgi:ABC-type transport system involved in cytochrome c biogenesis permease subunit
LAIAAVKGIATFSNVVLKTAGAYSLKATDASLASAISSIFNVTPATAAKLVFLTQPGNAHLNQAIAPAVRVAVEDAFGNVVTTDHSTFTLSILSGPAGGVLTGTLSVADVAGIASFSTLKLNKAGTYKIKATDNLLTTATSASFNEG